jgi:hypothetical protein
MYQTGIGIIIHHTIMPGILFRVPIQKQVSLNINNNYNYVNYRRSNQAVVLTTRDVQMGMKDNIQIIFFEKKYQCFKSL